MTRQNDETAVSLQQTGEDDAADQLDVGAGQNEAGADAAEPDALDDDQDDDDQDDGDQDDGDQLDAAESVAEARREAARYRARLRTAEARADQLGRELWRERVAALGILADPDDLPYDADALDDADAIEQAVETLVTDKPHLRARRVRGSIGQHEESGSSGVSLGAILRAGA